MAYLDEVPEEIDNAFDDDDERYPLVRVRARGKRTRDPFKVSNKQE